MAGWTLTKGLTNLRTQIDVRFPNRDRTSDGTIGDILHQLRTSGHNRDDTPGSKPAWDDDPDNDPEVRAIDTDDDLRDPEINAQELVDWIRKLPNVSSVLRYMIYNGKMYHSRDGWAPTVYTGSNQHTEHIHFEGAWSQAADNNTTFDYRLDELGDFVDEATMDKIARKVVDLLFKEPVNIGGVNLGQFEGVTATVFNRTNSTENGRLPRLQADVDALQVDTGLLKDKADNQEQTLVAVQDDLNQIKALLLAQGEPTT